MFTAVAWGTNIPVVKQAMQVLNPWVFNASRLFLAAIVLGVAMVIERSYRRSVSAENSLRPFLWRRFVLFSLLNGFFYQYFFFQGITRTTAGNTALLLSSMPMWTAILSFIFLRERLPRVTWYGLLITMIGTVIVTTQSGKVDLSAQYLQGNLFILAGAFTWASATVISRPLLQIWSPLKVSFWSSLLTMPLHVAMAWTAFPQATPTLQEPAVFIAIIYSGAISTGLAYATWHSGVRQLGGSHAAVYQNLVTLVAVLGSWLFLKEPFTVPQMLGGVAIVVGLLVMRRGRK